MSPPRITNGTAWAVIIVLSVTFAFIIGISYYAMTQFTFAGERIIYGKKLSELTREIRAELLKRPGVKEVTFTSEDKITLAGIMVTRPNARANVVLCHGYKGTKELMYAYVDLFPHWNLLLFDFRAHGQSEGTITSIGYHEYKDVIAAVKFMKSERGRATNQQLPLVIMGVSMGGAATLKAVGNEPDLGNALVVDSTYAELDQTMFHVFSLKSSLPSLIFYPVMKTIFQYYAHCDVASMCPVEYVKSIKQPILFIHSCDDNYILPSSSVALYANAKNRKSQLWIAPHCRHGLLHSYRSSLYQKHVYSFLKHVCTQCLA